MAKIEESLRQISEIISVIDEIARQANLLALKAAVAAISASRPVPGPPQRAGARRRCSRPPGNGRNFETISPHDDTTDVPAAAVDSPHPQSCNEWIST